jgi:hypothetical protein
MISDEVGAHLAWAATFNFEEDVYYLRIGDYDCNQNGIGDSIDIAQHTSHDYNANGIPDECEGIDTSDIAGLTPSYALRQNTPNPFNPRTLIAFDVPAVGTPVRLRIFDTQGHLVRTLFEGTPVAGRNSLWWTTRDVPWPRASTSTASRPRDSTLPARWSCFADSGTFGLRLLAEPTGPKGQRNREAVLVPEHFVVVGEGVIESDPPVPEPKTHTVLGLAAETTAHGEDRMGPHLDATVVETRNPIVPVDVTPQVGIRRQENALLPE